MQAAVRSAGTEPTPVAPAGHPARPCAPCSASPPPCGPSLRSLLLASLRPLAHRLAAASLPPASAFARRFWCRAQFLVVCPRSCRYPSARVRVGRPPLTRTGRPAASARCGPRRAGPAFPARPALQPPDGGATSRLCFPPLSPPAPPTSPPFPVRSLAVHGSRLSRRGANGGGNPAAPLNAPAGAAAMPVGPLGRPACRSSALSRPPVGRPLRRGLPLVGRSIGGLPLVGRRCFARRFAPGLGSLRSSAGFRLCRVFASAGPAGRSLLLASLAAARLRSASPRRP